MIYYTKNLEKKEYNLNSNFLGSGTQGSVYKIEDDKCLKIYNSGSTTFEPCVFEIIKDLSLEGIYKLYDLLYYGKSLKTIGAYTMKYYQSEVDNILDKSIDYTLDNINILYNSVILLSEHKILLRDSIPANVILTKDQVVMIDMDYSIKTEQSRDYLIRKNIWQVLYLFRKLYEEGLKKKGINIDEINKFNEYLDYLFDYSDEPSKTLKRKIGNALTPMDLLYKRY